MARARDSTAFRLTEEQWLALVETTGASSGPVKATEVEDAVRRPMARAQGFGLSLEKRGAVEQHAMQRAAWYFKG